MYGTGNPKPVVTWSKGGAEIKDGGRVSVTCDGDTCSLTIKDSTPADSGSYKCKASNSAGDITADIEVNVQPKPVKPS